MFNRWFLFPHSGRSVVGDDVTKTTAAVAGGTEEYRMDTRSVDRSTGSLGFEERG